jgi:AbiV family abortive infection protein
MSDTDATQNPTPYAGSLTPVDAANAIRAARINALDLLDTADLLFTMKRYCHAMVFATLAIEEAAKTSVVIMLFLGLGSDRSKLWKAYRNHRAKTSWLNPAIESRVRATFPDIPREAAKKIGALGPTPDDLEASKQRALYSDALEISGKFVCHLPSLVDWRKLAWDRLCEARAMAPALRDYHPHELTIWLKHIERARTNEGEARPVLEELYKELLGKGFVKEGWWDTILKDAEEEFGKQ